MEVKKQGQLCSACFVCRDGIFIPLEWNEWMQIEKYITLSQVADLGTSEFFNTIFGHLSKVERRGCECKFNYPTLEKRFSDKREVENLFPS